MSTLKIINTVSVTVRGSEIAGNQGLDTLAAADPFESTVLGNVLARPGTIPTASASAIWEAADDDPISWEYFWFCADQDVWLQLLTAGGQCVVLVPAYTPFTLPEGPNILCNASTAELDGTGAPALVAMTKIIVVNRSGSDVHTLPIFVE